MSTEPIIVLINALTFHQAYGPFDDIKAAEGFATFKFKREEMYQGEPYVVYYIPLNPTTYQRFEAAVNGSVLPPNEVLDNA